VQAGIQSRATSEDASTASLADTEVIIFDGDLYLVGGYIRYLMEEWQG